SASADPTLTSASTPTSVFLSDEHEAQVEAVASITANMIGRNALFETPFGMKAQCYADFTASGKPLQCVEDFVQKEVLPLYGNTHTTTSVTGVQMTSFREDARRVIAKAVNAEIDGGASAKDCVLFTGQGTTSAINKLVAMLNLAKLGAHWNPEKRPVVFVGPFEHHSNLLPWRESGAKVVIVPENDDDGKVCIATLTKMLERYAHRSVKIGAFSAASNLTGVTSDVDALATVLHQHGALACFDYATCGAYVKIDMNPKSPGASKDAVFVSGHKFIGGPGASGLLVVKTHIVSKNSSPAMPGGGTVVYVTHQDHKYTSNLAEREEGGTPNILGDIRLGLAFQVKERVGAETIMHLEHENLSRVYESLKSNPRIVLLGRSDVDKLPIFSFLVRFSDRFLHYNFVCALLNDLFGVLTRGGCQCAGPYGAKILGITPSDLSDAKKAIVAGQEVLKPGSTRMSFPYFMDASEVEYILRAVHFVADEGWKLLPQYKFDVKHASWTHRSRLNGAASASSTIKSLGLFDLSSSTTLAPETTRCLSAEPALDVEALARHRQENLEKAQELADLSAQSSSGLRFKDQERPDARFEHLRFAAEPQDAVRALEEGGGERPEMAFPIKGLCQFEKANGLSETVDLITRGDALRARSKRLAMKRWLRA
ncbi:hypothetical protein Gpo141_00014317, partial [Globisporangium polare]